MDVRVGVIGGGGMGREHITNLAAMAEVTVVVVADVVAESADRAAAIAGAEPSLDPAATASRSDLDAVVIASPDSTHADLAVRALEAGLWVLCEKPLATTVEDAAKVVQAQAALGVPRLQVGFMREYDPQHRQLAAAMDGLGPLHHLRAVHRNTNHDLTRPLDVVLSQSLIHDVHTAHWLTGARFASVVCQVVSNGDRINHVVILGEMTDGAAVTLEFAEATYGYDVEVEVTSELGMVVAAQPAQPIVRREGSAHRHIGDDWFGRFRTAYQREVIDWIEGIRAGEVRGPSAADGLAAQHVITAAMQSAANAGARTPVESS